MGRIRHYYQVLTYIIRTAYLNIKLNAIIECHPVTAYCHPDIKDCHPITIKYIRIENENCM